MSTVYLTPNPALKALGQRLFNYTGNKFQVVTSERVTINSHWDGGTRSYFAVVNGEVGQMEKFGQTGSPYDPPVLPVVEITPECFVVEHMIFCGKDMGLMLHVHPTRLPALLPAPSGELTRDEIIVLVSTRSLKSSYAGIKNYRFVEARRETGITEERWSAARTELIARGLLNKAGALTVNGRNLAGDKHLYELRHGQGGLSACLQTFSEWR